MLFRKPSVYWGSRTSAGYQSSVNSRNGITWYRLLLNENTSITVIGR